MWDSGKHCTDSEKNINDQLLEIKGELDDVQAQITFAKFLRYNPSFACQLLFGVELYDIQDIILRATWKKDFVLNILSRGFGKSFLAGIFIGLYAIFNPGVKIGICSRSFRQAKIIFKNLEDLSRTHKGRFFNQCILKPVHGPDAWEMSFVNGSRIICLPLGDGAKIRGYRFDVMVIDELLLLSDQTINEVIRPFLVVNSDPKAKRKIEEAIRILKENGQISEDDIKTIMPIGKKLIGLSSASYKFEYLYTLFESYMDKIKSDPEKNPNERVSHVIFQLSYKAAPAGLMNQQQIDEARATMSNAQFAREIESQFTDDSSGFFSAQKMLEATFKDGQHPCTRITGDPEKKYILAIDPNYNDSETSDHFAMAVTELDEAGRTGTLVHCYALSKSNIAARARYVAYLLKNFNIVFIILDNAGGNKFIGDINESAEFKEAGYNLKFLNDIDFMESDYTTEVQKAKNEYNLTNQRICYSQLFEGQWIRVANEHLQGCIENKRIMFASTPGENDFYLQMKSKIPIETLEFADEMPDNRNERLRDFIEHQPFLIKLTKTECALIEVSTSPQGKQTFDLPRNLKGSNSPDRPRKDSYTVLLLNNWAIKCYFDLMGAEAKKRQAFIPLSFS